MGPTLLVAAALLAAMFWFGRSYGRLELLAEIMEGKLSG